MRAIRSAQNQPQQDEELPQIHGRDGVALEHRFYLTRRNREYIRSHNKLGICDHPHSIPGSCVLVAIFQVAGHPELYWSGNWVC